MKPLILLTNDDGIKSPGIIAAAKALADLGELWVAAPHVQQTSAGRSHPPKSQGVIMEAGGFPEGVKAFSVEGSPSQCVDHAVLELLPGKPDLVVSGINSGVNVGVDITRSGTIGAALEAANYRIPAVAGSLEIHPDEVFAAEPQADFSTAAWFVRMFSEAVLKGSYDADIDILKIEVPDTANRDTPWEVTRLSRNTYYHVEKPYRTAMNKSGILRWRLEADISKFEKGTDVHTIFVKRKVSVTPLSLDLTSRTSLAALQNTLTKNIGDSK